MSDETDLWSSTRPLRANKLAHALIDSEFQILAINVTMREWLANEVTEWVGVKVTAVFPELVGNEESLCAILNGEEKQLILPKIYRPGSQDTFGRYFDLQVESALQREKCLLLTLIDVTEQAKLEQMLRQQRNELRLEMEQRKKLQLELHAKNEELKAFAYSVSHDLRAPLRAIEGFSRILAQEYRHQLDDQGQRYFNYIIKASEQLNTMIEDLLVYSRLGQKVVQLQPVSLQEVIDKVLVTFAERIAMCQARVEVAENWPWVVGNWMLLDTMMSNLLDNALKYGRSHTPPHIHITHQTTPTHVTIAIQDNGIGIDPQYHDKIFRVFQRLHTDEQYEGTGIGLAMVQKAVQMMQGKIWLESALNQGTTFYIQLPKADM
ncbi:MAG: GHKL domain-containing protein [Chloroflexi bacterium]|nr:MAG: GHKL domain-containing protein [Chloroflexota bacterium]